MVVEHSTARVRRNDMMRRSHSIGMAVATAALDASGVFIVVHTFLPSHTGNSYSCIGGKSEAA